LWFKSIGHEVWFSYYLTSVIAIALLVAVTMRDTKRYSALRPAASQQREGSRYDLSVD
jgi:hypothetical protein